LERGDEFCRCRHIRTGYEMDILTKYVYGSGEICTVNDCTDYVLPISPGDELLIVETTSRGYFVKHKGISGWYYGKIG
ncbi:MAG: serine/threonine protein phosphatase, partial [Oscillospiraceae bacterium]|nr:serine/threonine protein phosphatase [Oscillospiraceae bacterium]